MFVNRVQVMALTLSALVVAGAQATEAPIATTAPMAEVSQTVNQMLQIDAERALMAEQKMLSDAASRMGGLPSGRNSVTAPTASSAHSAEEQAEEPPKPVLPQVSMELLGIFGIGNNLMADLEIGGNRVRFKRGQALPIGASSDYQFRLVAINVPCVKIAQSIQGNSVERNVCFSNVSR